MHPTWERLLERHATPDERSAARRVEAGGDVYAALPDVVVLNAAGDEAVPFLQGQLTCDVAEVGAGASRLGAWCNAKGRVAVLFRLLPRSGGIDLLLPAAQLDETRKRLGMYVLRAKVTLSPEPDRLCVWAAGDRCSQALAGITGAVPTVPHAVVQSGDTTVVRLSGEWPSFMVLAPASDMEVLWGALASVAEPAPATAFELDRVRAAEPVVTPPSAGVFVPQMLNLELLDAVSFTKGCYIGQEVVARTQHLGKLKRRMYRARVVPPEAEPVAGDPIYASADGGAQSVGAVVRTARLGDGTSELLAVLRIDAAEAGELHLRQILGPSLTLLDMPYALND